MRRWKALAATGTLGKAGVLEHGHEICRAGDPVTHAFVLLDGVVEIVHGLGRDRSIVVKLLCGPTFFGILETVTQAPRFLETVRVLDHAIVHRVACDEFIRLLVAHPLASLECLTDLGGAFAVAARFERAHLLETDAVLANLLLAYVDLFGEPGPEGVRINLRRSQTDLAQAVGGSERQVNRILADWRRREWVDKAAARYVVRDPAALEKCAGGLSGSLVHRFVEPPEWLYRSPTRAR